MLKEYWWIVIVVLGSAVAIMIAVWFLRRYVLRGRKGQSTASLIARRLHDLERLRGSHEIDRLSLSEHLVTDFLRTIAADPEPYSTREVLKLQRRLKQYMNLVEHSDVPHRLVAGAGLARKKPKQLDEIIEEKKHRLLSIPSVSFHFANKEQIRSFYNDYFREPTIESLVSEIAGEITGEIKGSLSRSRFHGRGNAGATI